MDTNDLRHRLRTTPFDFFSAVASSTLDAFDERWHSFCEDIHEASRLSLLSEEDKTLVHATATQVATWSQHLLKIDDEAAKSTASFVDEIEDVFTHLAISNVQRPSPLPTPYRRGSRSTSAATPSYIPAAYNWMLENIHDPYPSGDVKQRLSRDTGRPLRVITDWFKEVRRYIGWVAMCKKHFQGSRAHTVQAAKHVYLQSDSTSQLSSSPDIISQFGVIRTRLRGMYPMADDNGNLSDSTNDSLTSSSLSSRRPSSDQSPYARSRSSSSTPSLVFSTDDEDNHSLASFVLDDAPVSLGKRKSFCEEDESRVLKRNRSGFISVANGLVDVMPPATSTSTSSSVASDWSIAPYQLDPSRKRRLSVAATEWEDVTSTPSLSSPKMDSCSPLRTAKRRLSMSDSQPSLKRPCLPPAVGPRKQAVSTPIPIVHQTTPEIDDWFRTFELPDTSLSVELFSNWDLTIENDVFPYNSLNDGDLQSDSADPLNVTPFSDVYQSSIPLDLGVSSAIDPSVLGISSAFTESPAPLSTLSPRPITATASSTFDLLDAFLSTVNAESAEPQSTQSSLSPYAELSLDDSIDIFGDLVDP